MRIGEFDGSVVQIRMLRFTHYITLDATIHCCQRMHAETMQWLNKIRNILFQPTANETHTQRIFAEKTRMSHRRNGTIYLKMRINQRLALLSILSITRCVHMDNTFLWVGNCCNRYSNPTKSRSWRLRCESRSAINRIGRPCSSAAHHLRSIYLCCCR